MFPERMRNLGQIRHFICFLDVGSALEGNLEFSELSVEGLDANSRCLPLPGWFAVAKRSGGRAFALSKFDHHSSTRQGSEKDEQHWYLWQSYAHQVMQLISTTEAWQCWLSAKQVALAGLALSSVVILRQATLWLAERWCVCAGQETFRLGWILPV